MFFPFVQQGFSAEPVRTKVVRLGFPWIKPTIEMVHLFFFSVPSGSAGISSFPFRHVLSISATLSDEAYKHSKIVPARKAEPWKLRPVAPMEAMLPKYDEMARLVGGLLVSHGHDDDG